MTARERDRSTAGDDVPVRRADLGDLDEVVGTFTAGFSGYAWTDWMLPADNHEVRLRESFALYTELTIRHLGQVWMTEGAMSAAAWIAPGPPALPDDVAAHAAQTTTALAGERTQDVHAVERFLQPFRPTEPHWFLASTATRANARRQGLASRVLTPILELCDATGTTAALETSSRENVDFYHRLGFEVSHHLQPPHGAPPVWLMTRHSREAGPAVAAGGGYPTV